MRFVKERMIERVKAAGKEEMLTEDVMKIMDNLDGCEATTSCWLRQVRMEPVMWVVGKNGEGEYVHEDDCI